MKYLMVLMVCACGGVDFDSGTPIWSMRSCSVEGYGMLFDNTNSVDCQTAATNIEFARKLVVGSGIVTGGDYEAFTLITALKVSSAGQWESDTITGSYSASDGLRMTPDTLALMHETMHGLFGPDHTGWVTNGCYALDSVWRWELTGTFYNGANDKPCELDVFSFAEEQSLKKTLLPLQEWKSAQKAYFDLHTECGVSIP